MRNKLLIIAVIIVAFAGYLYFSKNHGVQEAQIGNQPREESGSRPIGPEELKELQADPNAPDWLKNAESCTWVDERVFCKMKGE